MKEAMKKPIAALPVKELCEYEKIIEENKLGLSCAKLRPA